MLISFITPLSGHPIHLFIEFCFCFFYFLISNIINKNYNDNLRYEVAKPLPSQRFNNHYKSQA